MQQNHPLPAREPIINEETLQAAAQALAELPDWPDDDPETPVQGLVQEEPALRDFLLNRVLIMAGRMAATGAPPKIVIRVCREVNFLLNMTFGATRLAQRTLYEGLMPKIDLRTHVSEPQEKEPS